MKKCVIVLLFLSLCFSGLVQADVRSDKILIVYYSQSGKNKLLAEHLDSQIQNSEIQQINTKEEIGFGSLILKHIIRGELEIEPINIDAFDTVIICTPIWLQMLALPTKVFIEESDFNGKDVYVFITCGGFYGFSDSLREWISDKNAKVKDIYVVKVGGKTDEEIKQEVSDHLKSRM
jgi:flavodoxin